MTNLSQILTMNNVIASSISDGDTTHAPDGNSVYDALATKAPLASPTFSGTVDVSSATLTLADNQISKDKISGFQNKNLIINGDMSISQRGTSFDSTTTPANSDDTYLLDRWTLLSDGNDIADVTQQTGGGVNGNEYFLRLDVETAQKKFGIIQIIESKNCRPIIGKTCSLSFEAKVTNATKLSDIRAMVVSWAGTADAVTSDCINAWGNQGDNPTLVTNWTAENTASSLGVTTSWARYTIENISVDTASTKQVALFIWQNNVAANDTAGIFLEITNVQIESGGVATDFECRPYGLELMLCQRYYYNSVFTSSDTYIGGFGICTSATAVRCSVVFPNVMRVKPTITFGSSDIDGIGAFGSPSALDYSSTGIRTVSISNGSAGKSSIFGFNASAEL